MGMLASMWGSRFRIEFESQPLQKASQKSSPAKLCRIEPWNLRSCKGLFGAGQRVRQAGCMGTL